MKLFVDDIREPPDSSWVVARTYHGALTALRDEIVDEISLDHDLGGMATGYDLCKWMCAHGVFPKRIMFHTANPIGRANMFQLMSHYAPEEVLVEW